MPCYSKPLYQNKVCPDAPKMSRRKTLLPKKTLPLEEWSIVSKFLIEHGVDPSTLTSGVYLFEEDLDGHRVLKIGITDTVMTVKTPFSTKKGRISTTLSELRKVFNEVEFVKIHCFLQEDTARNLFKLDVEAFLLRQTKPYYANPSSFINYKEFRCVEGLEEILALFRKISTENDLNLVC